MHTIISDICVNVRPFNFQTDVLSFKEGGVSGLEQFDFMREELFLLIFLACFGWLLFFWNKCIATLDPHTGNEYKYKNFKRPTDDWADGRMDGRTYYAATQGILTRGLRPHVLHVILVRANNLKKATRNTGQRYRETDGRT